MSASTTIVTDLTGVQWPTATPTAASTAKAIAAAGPIMDQEGMLALALEQAKELKNTLTKLQTSLDSSDPIYTTISNDLLSFA